MIPTPWWRVQRSGTADHASGHLGPLRLEQQERGPVGLTGAALTRSGLTIAPTHPEQVATYLVEALD